MFTYRFKINLSKLCIFIVSNYTYESIIAIQMLLFLPIMESGKITRMKIWSLNILQYKSISWMLVAVIFMLAVLPSYLHIHHADTLASQQLSFDLHFVTDNSASEHNKDATFFPSTSDVLVKKVSDNPLSPAILVCLFIFLLVNIPHIKPPLFSSRIYLKLSYIHLTPPLRAPPL